MTPTETTPGKELLKEALPEKYHGYLRQPLDKKQRGKMMTEIARNNPEIYGDVLTKISKIGHRVGSTYGRDTSLNLSTFQPGPKTKQARNNLREKLNEIKQSDIPKDEMKDRMIETLSNEREKIKDAVMEDMEGKPFGTQIRSGVRGNPDQLTDIVAGEMIAQDAEGLPLPFPIDRGWSEGLTPSQYFMSTQKARTGLIGVKLATPEAGDLSNQITQAVQKLRVTEEHEPEGKQGLPVDPTDVDYHGSILAADVEGIGRRGDKLTTRMAREMDEQGIDEVLVHSPITSRVPYGLSKDATGGATGIKYELGDHPGIEAAGSVLEPFQQKAIGSKHVGQRKASGSDLVKLLLEVPKSFPHAAALAKEKGAVESIESSDLGGGKITVGGEEYQYPPGEEPLVEEGDVVNVGDRLSSGIPNPSEIVDLVGVGEGRRRFAKAFSDAVQSAGIDHNKRNIEYIARGVVDHAEITEPYEDWVPGDIMEYNELMRRYSPRDDSRESPPHNAKGKYLEEQVAHYTPGTKITEPMAKKMEKLGFDSVVVHDDPPPFKPVMRRAREAKQHSPSWIERMGGSNLKASFRDALEGADAVADVSSPTELFGNILTRGRPKPIEPENDLQKETLDTLGL